MVWNVSLMLLDGHAVTDSGIANSDLIDERDSNGICHGESLC